MKAVTTVVARKKGGSLSRFPDNCRFAFTVVDDTDSCTLENISPVYRLLAELGFRTTKTVWPLPNVPGNPFAGCTLQDPAYCTFIQKLAEQGFEIGMHSVRNSHSERDVIEQGLKEYYDKTGLVPNVQVNHHINHDNLYWGKSRFTTSIGRLCYGALAKLAGSGVYGGHEESSPYFWGDIGRECFTYVRSFVFDGINLDHVNPTLPYYNPAHPYVNYWFTSVFGNNVTSFCHTIREENQDLLEAEGGVCIMYTHFASGFVKDGRLNPRFVALMQRLAKKNGWFVPATTLLDHLRGSRSNNQIPAAELRSMEMAWLRTRIATPGQELRHLLLRNRVEAPEIRYPAASVKSPDLILPEQVIDHCHAGNASIDDVERKH